MRSTTSICSDTIRWASLPVVAYWSINCNQLACALSLCKRVLWALFVICEGAFWSPDRYFSETFPATGNADVAILDMCSSWISHYPEGYTAGRISGMGMNKEVANRQFAFLT